jgi:hypothetical protein
MFRESPRFIVAGEIVRTSRTYARSVSPLRESWIRRLSPRLAESLLGQTGGRQQPKRGRDTTWQIRIGTHVFPLKATKGKKKVALIGWDELQSALTEKPVVLPQFHSLKGKLVFQDLELLSSVKVADIMRIGSLINPHTDLVSKWPRAATYDSYTSTGDLTSNLELILKMCRAKKSGKRVGFISLQTDGDGQYWFKPIKDFYQAAAESLAAMEQLVDELDENADEETHTAVNTTYRRLSALLEE